MAELSDDERQKMDVDMGRLISVLKGSGLSPGPELAGMLVCLAASFYVMEGFDQGEFLDTARQCFDAAHKQTEDWPAMKKQAVLLLRMMRNTPVPGSEEARAKGCTCPSEAEAVQVLGSPPTGAMKQFALDPACKVHGELTMRMATSAGIAGSA